MPHWGSETSSRNHFQCFSSFTVKKTFPKDWYFKPMTSSIHHGHGTLENTVSTFSCGSCIKNINSSNRCTKLYVCNLLINLLVKLCSLESLCNKHYTRKYFPSFLCQSHGLGFCKCSSSRVLRLAMPVWFNVHLWCIRPPQVHLISFMGQLFSSWPKEKVLSGT